MKNLLLALSSCTALFNVQAEEQGYPSATLANDKIEMVVYLPDAEDGYYRAPRFDWAGMIAYVKWEGHTVFGEWRDRPHKPKGSDDVVGPAEEFGMDSPPGYDTAEVGETFVKIGVGSLRKIKEPKYWFPKGYEIVNHGEWAVTHGDTWIQFVHALENPRGYAYRYTKRIELSDDKPGFTIARTLENTGDKPLVSSWYCHNFVVFDRLPVGPEHRALLPYEVENPQVLKDTVKIEGRRISFLEPTDPGKGYWAQIKGFTGDADDHDFRFQHTGHDVSLRAQGDRPLSKVVFYAIGKAFCLEPFMELDVPPGEEYSWTTAYTLSTVDK